MSGRSHARARFGDQPSADGPPLSPDDDDADYAAFYKGRHAFECLAWECSGGIYFIQHAPVGYDDFPVDGELPSAILDDRAFARGFFKAPFEVAMDPCGLIRAKGLSPDISLRELSARLQAAVAARQAADGVWKEESGDLNTLDEDAVDWASWWKDEGPGADVGWCGEIEELTFDRAYWLERPYIEGYSITAGSAAGGGFIFVNSWGS